ncbi:hypothetical protein MtrunA17_Chr8g0366921 [Medicago truncatula]|nr:hypothetical protein MtrunA17_Chr8g0366921 [Medicago truncatula]
MENDDWDLFSIVRSCKATNFCETATPTLPISTNTITNNIISPHNTMSYCFDDFTLTQENSTIPISPLKPNDYIELDKLIIRSNVTKIIPIPTTSDIPTPSITTTTSPTSSTNNTIITTPSTITIPNHITTDTITNTSSHGSDQNSTFFYFPTLIEQQQMQPSEFTELEKWILQFNPTTTIPISTITTPNPTSSTPITFTTPTTTINTPITITTIIPTTTTTTTMTNYEANGINQYSTVSNFPMLVEQQQVQANQNRVSVFDSISCIKTTTTNFHPELNHPLVPEEPQRNHNQLPILLPQTSSTVLLSTNPKHKKFKSGKR